MPRMARVFLENSPHHIVQRAHNRKAVFVEDADYKYYLNTLEEFSLDLGVHVNAYCLMTNHVHLVINPGSQRENISLLMKRLAGRQTRYVNKQEGRSGSLWEGRYKCSPIDSDDYLLTCCRYVELNPVKANMVSSPEEYAWSSYSVNAGFEQGARWLGLVDIEPNAYKDFVASRIDPEEQIFLQRAVASNQLTGSLRFIDEVEERTGIRVERRNPGRPKK